MALAVGTRLGPYEVIAPIGAGGMGEVYRACDTKLNRDVALKILPDAFALDGDRIARFRREAQVLAALNHPNIAAIYGFEDSGSTHALVLELVEGPTLADRIVTGPAPLHDALLIAKQIAEALEMAHEHGIVHRDLKPANIKVRSDGTVKVLDFGLAKAVEPVGAGQSLSPDLADSPTFTSPVMRTQMGVILGTAAYMSPEQACGTFVDKRTDLWAFGVVLFELLTGAQLFTGDTTSHVLASVLKSEPEWSKLPADTPTSLKRLLRRCLERDRRRRLADASDARLEIEDALTAPQSAPRNAAPAGHGSRWLLWSGWGAAAIAILAASVQFWRAHEPAALATPVYSFIDVPTDFVLGEDDFLVQLPLHTPMVFTPDGRSLILQGARDKKPQLFIRSLDHPEARPIAGTDDARVPFVSPNGKWIGFWASNELRKVPIDGGEPTTICSLPAALGPNGAVWGPDDVILYGDDAARRIMRVSAAGGVPVAVTQQPPITRRHVTPFFLPDGRRFLFADISSIDAQDERLVVANLNGGEPRLVVDSATDGRLVSPERLVFIRLGVLMSARFDLTRAAIVGDPVVAMRNVMQSGLRVRAGANNTGAGMFALSGTGALAVVHGTVSGGEDSRLVWVTRDGQVMSAETATGAPIGGRLVPRISPDRSRAMTSVITALRWEVWFLDWARDVSTPCRECDSVKPGLAHAWSRDGKQILLDDGDAGSLVALTIDGSSPRKMLVREEGHLLSPAEWLADGRIVYVSGNVSDKPDSWPEIKLLEAGASTGHTIATGVRPAVSPNGQWLAYVSVQPGQRGLVVQAFPGAGPRALVSAASDESDPTWSADGRTIYYLKVGDPLHNGVSAMMAVDIGAKDALTVGKPRTLFQRHLVPCAAVHCYDVMSSSGGPRFLLRDEAIRKRESVTRLDLVLNWTSTLQDN